MAKEVANRVERILKRGQEFRDSDKKLLMAVWAEEGLHFSRTQIEAFMAATPAESITRARRDLKSKYPASKEVDDRRYELFQEERNERSEGTKWYRA
jgi:hypothetical protein